MKIPFKLTLVGIVAVGLVAGYIAHGSNTIHAAVASVAKHGTLQSDSSTKVETSASMQNVVNDMNNAIAANAASNVTTAATLIDLDSGQEYDAGSTDTIFKAASTAKVLAAVDYLHEVEQGNATLTQDINGTPAQQLIQQMIEISDNQAWADLNDYLGDQQQAYATQIGLSSFTGGDYNTMTAKDEAKLLQLLWDGKLINAAHQQLLLGYMEHTDSTNLIQAALPSSATVYHKYGELWGNLHDAAIITSGSHHFVLVIFTNDESDAIQNYDAQVALIHAVALAAYNDVMGG